MFEFFGWLWIFAGIAVAVVTFGLAFPIYGPMMVFGMICLLVSSSGKSRRALERLEENSSAGRDRDLRKSDSSEI